MGLNDHELLQRLKDDDPRVVTQLYKQYRNEFIRFVHNHYPGFKTESAEDAYSESFHALYRNVKQGKLVSLKCKLKIQSY